MILVGILILECRFSRKWIIFLCLGGTSLCLFLTSGTANMISLIIMRGLTAGTASAIFPVSRKIINDVLPPSSRSKATVCSIDYFD